MNAVVRRACRPVLLAEGRREGAATDGQRLFLASRTMAGFSSDRSTALVIGLIALVAAASVLLTLDPAGGGPGVTVDEYYDVAAGKALVQAWRRQGLRFFSREAVDANFAHLTLHPPLGRWLLGWAHAALDPDPQQAAAVSVVAGRIAPALGLALLVMMAGHAALRAGGGVGGITAAAAVALSPRLWGDAHCATLDMLTACTSFAALVALVEADARNRLGAFAVAGCALGLAMLTKLHGLLLVIPAGMWLVARRRRQALLPGVVWLVVALATFGLGWPWLWYDTWERLREFLSTATDRQVLHVFYQGRSWDDRAVPWHYPWMMLAVTVPVGWLPLAALGVQSTMSNRLRDGWTVLPALAGGFLLCVFSWPGTPVYDGTRLFSLVYPALAVLIGQGATAVFRHRWVVMRPRWLLVAGWCLWTACQCYGLYRVFPYGLSYYNACVGGLSGAAKRGFEVSYWGEAVQHQVLEQLAQQAPGQMAVLAPELAPYHTLSVALSSPELLDAQVTLLGWDAARPERSRAARWAIVFHRRADLQAVEFLLHRGRLQAEVSRDGVWLARLFELPDAPDRLEERKATAPAASVPGPAGSR